MLRGCCCSHGGSGGTGLPMLSPVHSVGWQEGSRGCCPLPPLARQLPCAWLGRGLGGSCLVLEFAQELSIVLGCLGGAGPGSHHCPRHHQPHSVRVVGCACGKLWAMPLVSFQPRRTITGLTPTRSCWLWVRGCSEQEDGGWGSGPSAAVCPTAPELPEVSAVLSLPEDLPFSSSLVPPLPFSQLGNFQSSLSPAHTAGWALM